MPARRRGLPTGVVEVLAVFAALVGPVTRATVMPALDPLLVGSAVGVGTLGTRALGERRWPGRMSVAALVGAILGLLQGTVIGVWAMLSIAVADWGIRRWRPVPVGTTPPPEMPVAVTVITVLAAWRGADTDAVLGPLVVLLAAFPVLTLSAVLGERFDGGVRHAAARFGHVLGSVVFGLLGLVVILVPWAVRRTAHVDELATYGRSGAWLRRDGRPADPRRPWAVDRVVARRAVAPRIRVLAIILGMVGLGAWAVWTMASDGAKDRFSVDGGGTWWTEPEDIPAAYRGADWYPEYREDIEWVMNQQVAFRPLHPIKVLDVTTRHVNVVGGTRVTWSAPPCGACRRITVWVYGGSTVFGIGQRDEHTIPSELARVASEKGLVLDVVNRGMPGDLHWQESQRLAWDLATGTTPDLVIFYDGANELWAARSLNDRRAPVPPDPTDPMLDQFWAGVENVMGRDLPPAPPDAHFESTTTVPARSPTEIGELAVRRYNEALATSRAAASDVATRWFWQPTSASRPPVGGEPQHADGGANARETSIAARSGLPEGVADLSDVFDDVDQPLYSDEVHHNEVGARIVAEAIFAAIRTDLDALSGPG